MASARFVFKKSRTLLALIAILAVGTLLSIGLEHLHLLQGISFVSTATVMGLVGNIKGVDNTTRKGRKIKYKVFLLSVDQVDPDVAFPTANDLNLANIPIKAGEYWHYIETIRNTPEVKNTGSDGDNVSEITNTLTLMAGGMADNLIRLLKTGIGEYFYPVWENCDTGERFIMGDGCQPSKLLSFEGGPGKEYTGYQIVFENKSNQLFLHYQGTTPLQPADVVPVDATTITLTANDTYQLQSGSAAAPTITGFTAVADSDVGRIVTIKGPNSIPDFPPVIAAGNDFLLIDGADWTANANASISFKIFKDGAATFKFMEIADSRI